MRRSIFQSLDSPELPSKLDLPLNYTKAEVIEHLLDWMLWHNFVSSIYWFFKYISIFQTSRGLVHSVFWRASSYISTDVNFLV